LSVDSNPKNRKIQIVKKLYPKLLLLFSIFISFTINALCQPIPDTATTGWPGGLATLKWDTRNYLITTGNNAGYVTAAMSTTQAFSIGTSRVTMVMGSGITTTGKSTTFTGTANSYSTASAILMPGETTLNTIAYNGSGTLTLTFDTAVSHVAFSLFDIDSGQVATITAKDPSGTALNITMASAAASVIDVVTGSGTTSAKCTAALIAGSSTSNTASVNVYILGFTPAGTAGVKSVTITMSGIAGNFWLSDLWACIHRDFAATTYYNVAKPYTNQPGYVIANSENLTATVLAVTAGVGPTIGGGTLTAGRARYAMKDSSLTLKNRYLNSFGYDPYNYFLYYTYDGTAKQTTQNENRAIKKYNFNTLSSTSATMTSGTISTLIADITQAPYNIPVFDQGVESGAACFNDGSLYIGIEGSNADSSIGGKNGGSSSRYSMVWRIDFSTGDSVPYQACQVYAGLADNGTGTLYHDWGDITISSDTLYDFNEANSNSGSGVPGSFSGWLHYNMKTGLLVGNYLNASVLSGESGILWNGQVYRFASSSDTISTYLYNGTISTDVHIIGNSNYDWTTVGNGDASDAFKPPMDYGDAPASFDPIAGDPAVHDYDSTIKLGVLWNAEFAKKASADASGDGVTDDAFSVVPIYTHYQNFFNATVRVYNHSGANVTLAGWIDFNEDGKFEATEGATATVASGTSLQNVGLVWFSASGLPASADTVFMRLRVTSTSNGMTTSNMTGYYSNGEVEDYLIIVSDVLAVKLISFNATAEQNKYVNIGWSVASEMNLKNYVVQRSTDELNWEDLQVIEPRNIADSEEYYTTKDMAPLAGISYYRLKMVDQGGNISYGNSQEVQFNNSQDFSIVKISPNPFHSSVGVQVNLPQEGNCTIRLLDGSGQLVKSSYISGIKGLNQVNISDLDGLSSGVYIIEVIFGSKMLQQEVIKN
jgi:GEVED domain